MQFLAGGCRMNVVIGIDFTASNKCPADPTSLHYLHPDSTQLNPYEQVHESTKLKLGLFPFKSYILKPSVLTPATHSLLLLSCWPPSVFCRPPIKCLNLLSGRRCTWFRSIVVWDLLSDLKYLFDDCCFNAMCGQAIVSIVSILEKYDEDKNFEAYGFGGMLPNGQVLLWSIS